MLKYQCQSIMLKYHADIDFDKRLMCFASLDLDTRKSKKKTRLKYYDITMLCKSINCRPWSWKKSERTKEPSCPLCRHWSTIKPVGTEFNKCQNVRKQFEEMVLMVKLSGAETKSPLQHNQAWKKSPSDLILIFSGCPFHKHFIK